MTNDVKASDLLKLAAGVILLATWAALVVLKVEGASSLITFCSGGLFGLSAHYLTNYQSTPPDGTTVITTTPPSGGSQ